MLLKINCENLQDCMFHIRFNGETQTIDSENNEVSFDFADCQEYIIEIEQVAPKRLNRWISYLLFTLTCVIQGVFNILLINTERDWNKQINPYLVKAKHVLYLDKDTDIELKYIKSEFNPINRNWSTPQLKIYGTTVSDTEIQPFAEDFKIRVASHIRKIVSIFSVVAAILGFLLYKTLDADNGTASGLLIVLLAVLTIICIGISNYEYQKMKMMYNQFLKTNNR